jgi:hypothetical protein
VAHACNPSYSGGRDQEDFSSKPAQANSWPQDPKLKNPYKNRASGVAQGEGPEFKTPPKKKRSDDGVALGVGQEFKTPVPPKGEKKVRLPISTAY